MEEQRTDQKVIIGMLLILAGGLLLLDVFGLVSMNLSHYILNWKSIIIFVGIIVLAQPKHRITGLIIVAVGLAFWIPEFWDYRIRFSQVFWPLVLIGVGLLILSRRGGPAHRQNNIFSGGEGEFEGDALDELSLFGGGSRRITSKNFKGGRITAIFGGSEYDLRAATPAPEGAVLDVFTLFGGSKLVVPDDWNVKSELASIFGGYSDKRLINKSGTDSEKTLIIKGIVIFGGGEIKAF